MNSESEGNVKTSGGTDIYHYLFYFNSIEKRKKIDFFLFFFDGDFLLKCDRSLRDCNFTLNFSVFEAPALLVKKG